MTGIAEWLGRERWLPIPGYEGCYEVSDRGTVVSLTRRVEFGAGHVGVKRGRLMKPRPGPRGHLYITLSREGSKRKFFVHQLVLLAFVGPRPAGLVTRHLDGNELNNRLHNLTYGTYSENAYDAVRHGVHGEARLTHCLRDHEFSPENTRITKHGSRECLACRRIKNRRTNERRTAERAAQGRALVLPPADVVLAAREMYATSAITQTELAATFGVGQSTVSRWVRGTARREVPGVLTTRGRGNLGGAA